MAKKKQEEARPALNAWMVSAIIFAALLFLSLVWNGVLTVMILQGGVATAGTGAAAPSPAPTAPQPDAPGQAPGPEGTAEVSIDDRPFKGDVNAPVTVIEFSDFECGFCQRFYQDTLPDIQANHIDTGDVLFVYRHFQLFGDRSLPPMVASECAFQIGGNDAFWPVHDAIFETPSPRSNDQLRGFAEAAGLDMAAWDSCFANGQGSSEVLAIIDQDVSEGRAAGVSGTPTVFVQGNRIVGAQPYSVFQQAIEAEI